MAENNYNLEIESNPNNLLIVEEFVNYFAKELELPDDKLQNLLLAITEATTNAIIHGNKSDPSKMVKVNVFKEKEKVKIIVKDQGPGFNPSKVPDPTAPENLLKDSGRGVYLMKFYMDEVTYNNTPEGMETILVMHL